MKKSLLFVTAIVASIAFCDEPISSGDIVPGEWNSNYRAAKDYAVKNHIPFIAIVSKYPAQCHFCSMFHSKWTDETFLTWAKKYGAIMGALYTNNPDGTDVKWVDWVAGSNTGFPFVRLYWEKGDGQIVSDLFMGRNTSLGDWNGDGIKGTQADFIAPASQ